MTIRVHESLRGCLKSLGCHEPTQHETRHREINHRFTALRQPFIIFAQAAGLIEPAECAFDHPPARQQDKAFGPFRPQRDTQDKAHTLGDPRDQLPTIRAIDPDQAQLFAGPSKLSKEEPGSCWIGDRGRRHDHGHEQPQGIDQNMPFASFHLFAAVIATLSAQLRRLDALAIETAGRGVLVAARPLANLSAQGVVEALPVPAVTPLAEIPIDTGPLWVLMGEHAPFDAPVDNIKQGIDHRPHIELAVASTRFGWWDQIFDTIPFGIREVCGVWISVHPQSVLN